MYKYDKVLFTGENIMLKNKRRIYSIKKIEVPSKIKKLEHLNADSLFMNIHSKLEKIPEFRTKDVGISISDILMSAFAMFSLKDPSLLKFDERRKDDAKCQNLKNIYGLKNVPSDSRMREVCDEIDPKKHIDDLFKIPFRHLQRSKKLEPMVFYKKHYLLNLDGTGFFSSKKVSAPFCMEKKNKKTGEVFLDTRPSRQSNEGSFSCHIYSASLTFFRM